MFDLSCCAQHVLWAWARSQQSCMMSLRVKRFSGIQKQVWLLHLGSRKTLILSSHHVANFHGHCIARSLLHASPAAPSNMWIVLAVATAESRELDAISHAVDRVCHVSSSSWRSCGSSIRCQNDLNGKCSMSLFLKRMFPLREHTRPNKQSQICQDFDNQVTAVYNWPYFEPSQKGLNALAQCKLVLVLMHAGLGASISKS